MKRFTTYTFVALMALVAFGCRHKGFDDDERTMVRINVVFDWQKAPDAHPQSMALYLYPDGGGQPLRYVFQNCTGGEIAVPVGSYTALCVNNDNTDWAELRNTGDIETFEIHTPPVAGISLTDLRTSDPEVGESQDSALVQTPYLLWSDAGEVFSLNPSDTEKTLTMYPEESGCHYTIDIYDIDNPASVADRNLFATFSGVADGYDPGTRHPSANNVTMPLSMTISDDCSQIHGEFLNFGQCPDIRYINELRLHVFLTDGSAWTYSFDVTDQAHNAPDPRNVHIVLRGLPVPKPIDLAGGLRPVVEDWLVEHIDLNM
ncbi:MAG: DUF5119 domain-containing protein [Paramuribaculum sp.]|nr:DUF5119 domain-containing protein [Paramuribaculum sp.]MDE6782624.1 DUF5119 domain-containing protein [Paramuribaculum sp.]